MSSRRLWAAAAIACAIAALGLAIAGAFNRFPRGLTVLACLLLAVCSAWWGVRRRRAQRVLGIAVAGALVAGALVLVVVENRLLEDVLVIVAVAAALATARMAFRVHVKLPRAEPPAR